MPVVCLRSMQNGIAYAIWAGVGMVLVTISAAIVYREFPDGWAMLGISLIIAGVLVLNLLAKTATH